MFDLDELARWDEALKRLEAASPDRIRALWRAVMEEGRQGPRDRKAA